MAMKPNPIVHALPYPALEAGNLSFPKGDYDPIVTMGNDGRSVEIEHKVSGAPFIEKLIEQNEIEYYCLFSSPKSGVRKLFNTTQKGEIRWEDSIVGEPPKLRSILIYTGEEKEYTLTKECGVAPLWQGKKIMLPKGARLARGSFLYVNASENKFLKFEAGEGYKPGSFKIEPRTEGGFHFCVIAAQDVFNFVQKHGIEDALRGGILTGVAAQCFSILQHDYRETEEDSNEFSNLKALSNKLEHEFGCDWNDDEFDPTLAATTLYPIRVPRAEQEEEDDE